MVKRLSTGFLLAALILVALPAVVTAQDGVSMPALRDLTPHEWNQLDPGGDTICATGTPYRFFVQPAAADRLLIALGGGGGCWSFAQCDPASSPTYLPYASSLTLTTSLDGILNMDHPENPLAGYSAVTIPICTGDNHIGSRTTTYRAAGDGATREVTIFHHGYVNAMAALNWVFANFDHPAQIFVAGSSAGGVAAPFYGGLIAEHYPDAQIVVLGDSAGGLRFGAANAAIMASWGTAAILPDWPEYAGITADNLFNETFYIAAANRFPDVVFAEVNSAHDENHYFALSIVGVTDTPLPDVLQASYDEIRAATPGNFFTFTVGGEVHVILPRSLFYLYRENDVRLRDWVAALAAGEAVEDVFCTDCN